MKKEPQITIHPEAAQLVVNQVLDWKVKPRHKMTANTISQVRWHLKKGNTGTFRLLREGEEVLASDIVVYDCYYDFISESNVGSRSEAGETILRLEFDLAPGRHGKTKKL